MAQQTDAENSSVRKEADAELYTVDDDSDVWYFSHTLGNES